MAFFADARGQTWELEEVTARVQIRMSAWSAACQRQALHQEKEFLAPEAYKEAEKSLTEQIAAGSFRWGSPFEKNLMGDGLRAVLDSPDGKAKLLQFLLEKKHPYVTVEQAAALILENPEAVRDAMQEAIAGPNYSSPGKPGNPNPGGATEAKTAGTTTPA